MSSPLRPAFDEAPLAVAVLGRDYPAGAETGLHHHRRGQLLHATEGLMIVLTTSGRWAVPPGHAVWIPPEVDHDVSMHGAVAMRTAYVAPDAARELPARCRVMAVSPLLRAVLLAMFDEPQSGDADGCNDGRFGHLAALVISEIARAAEAPMALPLPRDRRLRAMTDAIAREPELALGLDAWAERIGMSRRSLTRRFRAETGLSFVTWRRRLRLMTAAALVADGMPPAKAHLRVGYRSTGARVSGRRQESPLQPAGHGPSPGARGAAGGPVRQAGIPPTGRDR